MMCVCVRERESHVAEIRCVDSHILGVTTHLAMLEGCFKVKPGRAVWQQGGSLQMHRRQRRVQQ